MITWCLWKKRCKARMEGVKENAEKIWRNVQFWMKILAENLSSIHKLSMHDIKIMEEFQLDRPSIVEKTWKIVTWSKPHVGWMKLNCVGVVMPTQETWEVEELSVITTVLLKQLFLLTLETRLTTGPSSRLFWKALDFVSNYNFWMSSLKLIIVLL